MAEPSTRADELFQQAAEMPNEERAAYLTLACAGDPTLRREVAKLLAAFDWLDDGQPPPHLPPPADDAELAGTVLAGRYTLLRVIGQGGMGSVWEAEQTDPVKRTVAVKLIRLERGASKAILARFSAERQAIALMDHPHIARLFDAGTWSPSPLEGEGLGVRGSQPFFVMELVRGVPLTAYCAEHTLPLPDRLRLFVSICSAVQHAHQKGVIHRDLKPGNILVESHDGKPVPKVIDFGLAKAAAGVRLADQTLLTGVGSLLGTPLYMAPEQATFNPVDVDTRADVYALGVILYELLTGTTPVPRETMSKAPLDEMLRLVREQEPPPPSSRTATRVANSRELDWVVLKALAKERERRYETASGFGKDVERFLNREPVQAGPPTAAYRLTKFVQRNRVQVAAGGAVLLALVGGVIGTTVGLLQADEKRKEAETARGEEAKQRGIAEAKEAAEAEQRGRAERANDRVWGTVRSTLFGNGTKSWLAQVVIREEQKEFAAGVLAICREVVADPGEWEGSRARAAEAGVIIGLVESRLGRPDKSLEGFRAAERLYAALASDYPANPDYRFQWGYCLRTVGEAEMATDPTAGEAHLREGLAVMTRLVADHPAASHYALTLADCHLQVGGALARAKRTEEGKEECAAGVRMIERVVNDHPLVAEYELGLALGRLTLARVFHESGDPAGALPWCDAAVSTAAAAVERERASELARFALYRCYREREWVYLKLKKPAEAAADRERVIDLSPPDRQPAERTVRADYLLRAGKVAEAVAEADELADAPGLAAEEWYRLGYVYTVAAGSLTGKKKEECTARATRLLERAVKAGFWPASKTPADDRIDPLRSRDDFKRLLADLEKKAPKK